MKLAQKRILITGATGGIGSHLAYALAKKGAKLALTGRNSHKLHDLQQSLQSQGHEVITIACDLTQLESEEQLLALVEARLGGLDIVICNAGVQAFVELDQQSSNSINTMIQTNVTALIQLSRAALKRFKQQNSGHFVFVGSMFGSLGFPHFATYCASKFAVHGFSQALRRELVDTDIGVTYIAPRGIDTAMNDQRAKAMFDANGSMLDHPEKVCKIIIDALKKEKQEVYIGQPERFFAWLNGLLPQAVNIGLAKQAKLAQKYL